MGQVLPLVTRQGDRIAIVSGLRTPFARQATAFHGIPGRRRLFMAFPRLI